MINIVFKASAAGESILPAAFAFLDKIASERYNHLMNAYLDYAATTPLLPEVLEQMLHVLKSDFGNPDSLHSFGRRAAGYVTDARDKIAAVLGVKPAEVYFTSGGTEADNWAVRGIGRGKALLSAIEHTAALSALPHRKEGGHVCDVRKNGVISPTHVEELLSDDTGLVCVMAVNNETGCVQPIEDIASATHARGAVLFSDCVQGACTLDLKEVLSHADGISLSAHKMGGPKGVGALVVKKGVPLKSLIVGGEQERGLRGGTLNVAGIVGFAAALEIAQRRREEYCARTGYLRDLFERRILSALSGEAKVDGENRAPNITHMTFSGGGEAFLNLLDLKGVACSGGAACSAHASKPSHVMLAMGRSSEEAKRGVRFSFSLETTEEEVLFAADTVIDCLK